MKKFIALIIALIVSSQGFAQTDGYYQKITKGKYWSDRPVARMIYGGSYPPGYTVYTLDQDYLVLFIDSKDNNLDRIPKGEKIYKENTIGIYYSAIDGNQIEYIKPVEAEAEQPVDETISTPVVDNYIPETQNQEIVVYHDNSYRYYQPYYEGTNMFWSMIGYEIFYNNLWHRVPYSQYYGYNQSYRRTSNLGKYRHSEPPRDTYRESRQRPQQGTRGTGLNHGNSGNHDGVRNGGNTGGPGGAPMTKSAASSRNSTPAVYQNGSSNFNRRPATASQRPSSVNNGYNQSSQRKTSTPSVKSSNPSSYRSNNAGFRNPSYTPSVKSSNAVRSSGYSTSSSRSSSSSSGQRSTTSRRR